MAGVAPVRAKRQRSPSPVGYDTLASPLEVLLKRRRRGEFLSVDLSGGWEEDEQHTYTHQPQSSPLRNYDEARPAIDRRRARQWERLQAPHAQSAPPEIATEGARQFSSPGMFITPTEPHGPDLSSSPVRHRPPSSTPFRADDEWTEEERMREWGEEYAARNSLLHSLHLARVDSSRSDGAPYSPYSVEMVTTPGPSSHHDMSTPAHPGYFARTPHLHPYAYRSMDPGTSPYGSSPAHSPYIPAAPNASPMAHEHSHGHMRASYEEANRLLAELNMQRMRRHHEPSSDDQWHGWQ